MIVLLFSHLAFGFAYQILATCHEFLVSYFALIFMQDLGILLI